MRLTSAQQPLARSRTLWGATRQLKDLAESLREDGLAEEAATLETAVRDLTWQYEALVRKELVAEWPSDSRQPFRVPLRVVR